MKHGSSFKVVKERLKVQERLIGNFADKIKEYEDLYCANCTKICRGILIPVNENGTPCTYYKEQYANPAT